MLSGRPVGADAQDGVIDLTEQALVSSAIKPLSGVGGHNVGGHVCVSVRQVPGR